MARQGDDPRKGRAANVSKFASGYQDASMRSLAGNYDHSRLLGDAQYLENPDKYRISKDFYRQNEVIVKQIPLEEKFMFDKSLDVFFKTFCKVLVDEISTGPVKRNVSCYVDDYGREYKGYLTYSEFKEIYITHVHEYDKKDVSKSEMVEEAKLRALFRIFDE